MVGEFKGFKFFPCVQETENGVDYGCVPVSYEQLKTVEVVFKNIEWVATHSEGSYFMLLDYGFDTREECVMECRRLDSLLYGEENSDAEVTSI